MSYARLLQTGAGEEVGAQQNSDRMSVVRNLLVHINGNRVTWEHLGMNGAVWRVNAERADSIFSYDNNLLGAVAKAGDADETDDRLSRFSSAPPLAPPLVPPFVSAP